MPATLLIDSHKYSIYVRVIAGQGDGPLITIDANGKIHVDHGDPGPMRDRLQAAVHQIEAGVTAFQQATAGHVAPQEGRSSH